MNSIPYDRPEEEWDTVEDEPELELPGRPRRRILTWASAGLFALLLGVIGFYVGVRVEKGQVSSSPSASAFSAVATGAGARAAGGARLRGLFGGAGGAGGGASLGTVSSISPDALYVTQTSGNTVKVTLSSATRVTKNVGVGKSAVRPGDLVVVQGAKASDGTVSATSVNDTGASPAAAAGGGSGGSSAASSGSSAVNSLFGGG